MVATDSPRTLTRARASAEGDDSERRSAATSTSSAWTLSTPASKREILDGYEKRAEKVEDQFFKGIITDGERRQKEVEIWTAATEEVRAALEREARSGNNRSKDMKSTVDRLLDRF